MGTRNLTAVMADGEYKIAQYGQWDGHPEGQGKTALAFCRDHLTTAEGVAAFKSKLARVSFFGDKPTNEEAEPFRRFWTRDNGAKILGLVNDATVDEIKLSNSINFAGDSLMCEWAYVVDLDRGTLEVFKGFNKEPLVATERFSNAKRDNTEYYPVRHVASFTFGALPTDDDFITACDPSEDEEV